MAKAKYQWTSDISRMLRILRASYAMKKKAGWSREAGAGFIKEDIVSISIDDDFIKETELNFKFSWGEQFIKPIDLNLRETEEAINFLLSKSICLPVS